MPLRNPSTPSVRLLELVGERAAQGRPELRGGHHRTAGEMELQSPELQRRGRAEIVTAAGPVVTVGGDQAFELLADVLGAHAHPASGARQRCRRDKNVDRIAPDTEVVRGAYLQRQVDASHLRAR